MKLFLSVHGFQECSTFQSDLNRLVDCCGCVASSLELNVGKCKSIMISSSCGIHLYVGGYYP
jgi:hypothetical protein